MHLILELGQFLLVILGMAVAYRIFTWVLEKLGGDV